MIVVHWKKKILKYNIISKDWCKVLKIEIYSQLSKRKDRWGNLRDNSGMNWEM